VGLVSGRRSMHLADQSSSSWSSSSSIISLLFFALETAGFAFFEGGLVAAVLAGGARYAKNEMR